MRLLADIYDCYHQRIGYRLCEAALGRGTFSLLAEMKRIDGLTSSQREKVLRSRLGETLNAARRTPFYRERLPDAKFSFDDSPEEILEKLPITLKDDIRRVPRAFVAETCRRQPSTTRTAGSTGQPLVAYDDPKTSDCVSAAMAYGRSWWGIRPGARAVNLWGHSKYLSGGWKDRIRLAKRRMMDAVMNRTVFPAYDLSATNLQRFVELVRRKRPHYLVGYASALHAAAAEFAGRKKTAGLKAVVSTGEVLYEWQQEQIEERLGVPVIQEYGLCEAGVIAYSCPSGSTHVLDALTHVELLDGANEPVKTGETGRIVITLLGRHDVIMLRYDTGDMAAEVEQRCSCGRPGRLIGRVQGRAYDLIRTPSGGCVPGVLFTHAMKYLSGVQRYCIVQKALDRIEVRFEELEPVNSDDLEEARCKMVEAVGPDVEIRFLAVEVLPREASGKFRWIRSELTTNQDTSLARG